MARFNTSNTHTAAHLRKRGQGPIATSSHTPDTSTHEGGPGYRRGAAGELFLACVGNMLNKSFYETVEQTDARIIPLIHEVAKQDPLWITRFVPWLRNGANMRTISLVVALEAAKAMLDARIVGGRQLVDSALQRADEPGEALGYWMSRYGRTIPKPIKRGIADAAARLYTQRAALKYDTTSKAIRFGDVLELCHPSPESGPKLGEPGYYRGWQSQLFKYLIDRGKGREVTANQLAEADLPMLVANMLLRERAAKDPRVLLNTAQLHVAGMNWEDVFAMAGDKLPKKELWTALIPTMGYMALLRNLRNFDEAGVSGDVQLLVQQKLQDPAEVAKSHQLPLRFLSAYRNTHSNNWALALERALEASLANVPEFPGSTLILVDTSGSMTGNMSDRSQLKRQDAATMFGLAMARRCASADVVSFDSGTRVFPAIAGESLLRSLQRWEKGGYFLGGGTYTQMAVSQHYRGHDRVVVITDEQAHFGDGGVDQAVPHNKLFLTFNIGGYQAAHVASSGTRHTIGGLTDAAFDMIKIMDGRVEGGWPF